MPDTVVMLAIVSKAPGLLVLLAESLTRRHAMRGRYAY